MVAAEHVEARSHACYPDKGTSTADVGPLAEQSMRAISPAMTPQYETVQEFVQRLEQETGGAMPWIEVHDDASFDINIVPQSSLGHDHDQPYDPCDATGLWQDLAVEQDWAMGPSRIPAAATAGTDVYLPAPEERLDVLPMYQHMQRRTRYPVGGMECPSPYVDLQQAIEQCRTGQPVLMPREPLPDDVFQREAHIMKPVAAATDRFAWVGQQEFDFGP
jgi:hypothetical protein